MNYTMPPEHQQRERDVIEKENQDNTRLAIQPDESITVFQTVDLRLEVLLDVRDLLRELVVGMSEVRGYLETIAIRAEQNLAEGFRNPKKDGDK
jgi:hypothetical protein